MRLSFGGEKPFKMSFNDSSILSKFLLNFVLKIENQSQNKTNYKMRKSRFRCHLNENNYNKDDYY